MNKVCLVGRLTTKPELKYTSSGVAVTRFNIAVNRTFTNSDGKREADFIPIQSWRKQAENICKYLDKGSLVSVEGRVETGYYTDQDGKNKNTWSVIADNVQFLENKKTEKTTNNLQTTANNIEDVFADFGEQVSTDDNYLD